VNNIESKYPIARTKNLLITKLHEETLVYDLAASRAFCMNGLMAAVWHACDGRSDLPGILDVVRRAGFVDATEATVELAIEELRQAALLSGQDQIDDKRPDEKRRDLLKKMGKSVAALPVISSVLISNAVSAASAPGPCLGWHMACTPGVTPCCSPYNCNVHAHGHWCN